MPLLEKEIKNMYDVGIIVPLRYSEWVSNRVSMRKKTGEIRLCIDFRNLNKASLKDNYSLPKMDHILQRVVGSKIISLLDGFSGYNQVLVLQVINTKQPSLHPRAPSCMSKCLLC